MSRVLPHFPASVPRACLAALAVALSPAAFSATNDLSVARQALRDGFWPIARAHAGEQARTRDDARQIVLESWAGEEKWDEILRALDGWGSPAGDVFAYHRAHALAKKGENAAARAVYETGLPRDPACLRLATRLLAGLALDAGAPDQAVETLRKNPAPEPDDKILLAEALGRLGREKEAAALWREVASATNATVRAVATAAVNLGDEALLRSLATNAVPADVRTLVRLRLGAVLLPGEKTFGEGAKLIRDTVAASPDAEGAPEAFRILAGERLRRGDWKGAAKDYGEILEIWPKAARIESVQEGLGWALLRQGRAEDALQAFRRAEACAATDDERAAAAVKAGDALVALGRADEALAACRDVLAKWPKAAVCARLGEVVRLRELELRGRALYREFRFAEAQKAFAEVGAKDGARRGRMAFFEALCLFGQGFDGEAVARAKALAKEADDPRLRADVAEWLAKDAFNGGRWREAKDLFSEFASSPAVRPDEAAAARVWAARAALAANDFSTAIALAAEVVGAPVAAVARADALIVQGEALLELARFDEAALVFERAALLPEAPAKVRLEAQILRADALYAMGADNPLRYEEALAAYRLISQSEALPDGVRLSLGYKIGLSLEKLKHRDEAVDQYYAHVVLAYRDARASGRRLDGAARAVFARAAFRLADLCEASGHFPQAQNTLELVAASDVPAASEAQKRIDRLRAKGVQP